MANQVQGVITLYVVGDTKLDKETFLKKFNEQNIVSTEVIATISDGSLHKLDGMEVLSFELFDFQDETENRKSH